MHRLGKGIEPFEWDCFIIAEIGTNFYDVAEHDKISNIEAAEKMILSAKANGADAVKFQTYKAERLTSNEEDLKYFKKYDRLSYDDYLFLIDFCKKINMVFLTTLFDEEGVEALGKQLEAFKIASPDITYEQLIRKVSRYVDKPVFISTGASTVEEIERAVGWMLSESNHKTILMHCVASYPTLRWNTNLRFIDALHKNFPLYAVGYSDHCKFNLNVLSSAYMMGAKVIEKHFTFESCRWKMGDHNHSMFPEELKNLREHFSDLERMIGYNSLTDRNLECEKDVHDFGRRSIFTKHVLEKGHKMTYDDMVYLRPGTGIPPFNASKVNNKLLNRKLDKNTKIEYNMFSEETD